MFIVPESVHLSIYNEAHFPTSIETVAFETPDSKIVLVILNTDELQTLNLSIGEYEFPDHFLCVKIEPKSIKTVIWNKIGKVNNKTKVDF
jgi:hypothetical protein